jgi:hypothetical protein
MIDYNIDSIECFANLNGAKTWVHWGVICSNTQMAFAHVLQLVKVEAM